MRITVKISDIEVTIERNNFVEGRTTSQEPATMNDVVLPTIKEAVAKAKELYQLKKLD